jgi:hypothetical protein
MGRRFAHYWASCGVKPFSIKTGGDRSSIPTNAADMLSDFVFTSVEILGSLLRVSTLSYFGINLCKLFTVHLFCQFTCVYKQLLNGLNYNKGKVLSTTEVNLFKMFNNWLRNTYCEFRDCVFIHLFCYFIRSLSWYLCQHFVLKGCWVACSSAKSETKFHTHLRICSDSYTSCQFLKVFRTWHKEKYLIWKRHSYAGMSVMWFTDGRWFPRTNVCFAELPVLAVMEASSFCT